MPIVEKDPWRNQYFEGVACPDDVVIPTDDELAYKLYPQHRWIYDKLRICESQGLEHAPHGIVPEHFPVFSKPIYNLRGMGTGGQLIESLHAFERVQAPGHMWMPLLEGEHVSTDVVVIDGEPQWWRHTTGLELGGGMFNYWTVEAEARPSVEAYCGDWLRRHLKGYTGAVNFETIGGAIIEAHLRFADQWVDLYGADWVKHIVELYRDGHWTFEDRDRCTGYSVVLFGAHGRRYRVEPEAVETLRARSGISSVQITFHADKPLKTHAMPPGGFRLAVINCWDLEAGLEARQELATLFQRSLQRTAPLPERLEILGVPVVELGLAADRPQALLAVRLCDVAPDGASLRVTYGLLNLSHRHGHARPSPMSPNTRQRVRLALNDLAHAFPAGHRIRLAVSTSYWPIVWPAPTSFRLTLYAGAGRLTLPVRPPRPEDEALQPFLDPEAAPAPEHALLHPARHRRTIERDLHTGEVTYTTFSDGGDFEGAALAHLATIDLDIGHTILKRFRIRPDDPLSARAEVEQRTLLRRGDWHIEVEANTALSATEDVFRAEGELTAYEGNERIFSRTWDEAVPRDHL